MPVSCKSVASIHHLSGAAERAGLQTRQIAFAAASHQGEAVHTGLAREWLASLGLGVFSTTPVMHAARAHDLATLELDLNYILARDPDHVDALNALGYTLADRTRRFEEAAGYIRKAFELQPDNPAILDSMGWVSYRLGDYDMALKYLRQALGNLNDPEIAAHLGEVLWVTGDRDGARAVWRKALAATPDSDVLREVMERLE